MPILFRWDLLIFKKWPSVYLFILLSENYPLIKLHAMIHEIDHKEIHLDNNINFHAGCIELHVYLFPLTTFPSPPPPQYLWMHRKSFLKYLQSKKCIEMRCYYISLKKIFRWKKINLQMNYSPRGKISFISSFFLIQLWKRRGKIFQKKNILNFLYFIYRTRQKDNWFQEFSLKNFSYPTRRSILFTNR